MDRNICRDGTVATSSNLCLVAYNSSATVTNGPVTAMTYLTDATSTWENVPNLDITYNNGDYQFINFRVTGKARLPYVRGVWGVGCKDVQDMSCTMQLKLTLVMAYALL